MRKLVSGGLVFDVLVPGACDENSEMLTEFGVLPSPGSGPSAAPRAKPTAK